MSVIDVCESQERMLECTSWQFNLKKTHFFKSDSKEIQPEDWAVNARSARLA